MALAKLYGLCRQVQRQREQELVALVCRECYNHWMGQFTPDVAISVDDRHAAAKHYEEVFGLKRGREGTEWIEMLAGPFSFYLTEEEPATSAMFAFAVDDVEATIAQIIAEGGEEISRKGGEVFVRDRYGLPICIESIKK